MHSIARAEVPIAENAEGPAHDFFLSYPYLLVWTDQVDVWRLLDASDATHVSTLDVYVTRPDWSLVPILDHVRGLLILCDAFDPILRIFTLHDGELARAINLDGAVPTVDIQYRQADGHALVLLVDQGGQHNIVEVDVNGSISDPSISTLGLVSLPSHLKQREEHGIFPPGVLVPIFFGENGDIIATSTTRWEGKVDVLYWQGGSGDTGNGQLTRTLELFPTLDDCRSMLPTRHLVVDASTLILCTHEEVGWQVVAALIGEEPGTTLTAQTSIRALGIPNFAVQWIAEPIPGKVETLNHIPSLNILVLSSCHDITNHAEDPEDPRLRTVVVVLDARAGDRLAINTVDSDAQGSWIVATRSSSPVGCFVSPDEDDPVLCLVWMNGDVLTIGLKKFMKHGFEREGDGERARTFALFPADVGTASVGRKELVVVAGVKKHPILTEGGRKEDIPDWEEEEGKVMFAKW